MTRPRRYLSRPEVATRIGVQRKTVDRYRLPPPDAITGVLPGWLAETIDAWDAGRPSRRKAQDATTEGEQR